jgi:hypothetical protein
LIDTRDNLGGIPGLWHGGLLRSRHRHDRALIAVLEPVSAFEDPAMPIPSESTALTGITDDDMAGRRVRGHRRPRPRPGKQGQAL